MKTIKLLTFLISLLAFNLYAQIDDNGTNVAISTDAPTETVSNSTKLMIKGSVTNGIGKSVSIDYRNGGNYNVTNSLTVGQIGLNRNNSSNSEIIGMNSIIRVSTARAIEKLSKTMAGSFVTELSDITGTKTFNIAGSYSELKGNWNGNSNLNGGFAGAVVGNDKINGNYTYAGYFKGRGYFSENVGIGSLNPTSALHVNGSGYFSYKLGIGVQNPVDKLHIHNGRMRLTGINSFGGPMILFGSNGQSTDNGQWGIEYVPQQNGIPGLNFWRPNPNTNSGNYFLFLADTGKVAVGTNQTPNMVGDADISDYKFYVEGGILTEEVRIRTDWADYVFNKDYDLKPLNEVERFIDENGHLPNVPSASQIKNNGLELGDIARIQQEKIEELMLYVIQQEKRIKALEKKINQ